jgi:DNA-binding NarL/FixJ family response regulator
VQRILAGEKWITSRLVDKLVNSNPAAGATLPLTPRQRDILHLLHQGCDNHAIARRMNLSVKTVENHLTRLYRQLNVQSRLEAANYINQYPEILALSGQQAVEEVNPNRSLDLERIIMLLVDDNARYRSQLRRMIGKVCAQAMIYEAANIKEATNLARQISPQLALVDVVLGEEDGIHCVRRIRALSPLSRIVLISAYPDREFHRRGLEAGAVAFLDKRDLDAIALRQVIDDVIG